MRLSGELVVVVVVVVVVVEGETRLEVDEEGCDE
jgi:hypothetical protein